MLMLTCPLIIIFLTFDYEWMKSEMVWKRKVKILKVDKNEILIKSFGSPIAFSQNPCFFFSVHNQSYRESIVLRKHKTRKQFNENKLRPAKGYSCVSSSHC